MIVRRGGNKISFTKAKSNEGRKRARKNLEPSKLIEEGLHQLKYSMAR